MKLTPIPLDRRVSTQTTNKAYNNSLTKDEGDVYRPGQGDRHYAIGHPFRRLDEGMQVAIRVPPLDFTDLISLTNLLYYNYTGAVP